MRLFDAGGASIAKADNPGVRISLLHFDCDLYRPTITALQCLWDLVVPGGIVAFDEYGIAPWEGESLAVDLEAQQISGPGDLVVPFEFEPFARATVRLAVGCPMRWASS